MSGSTARRTLPARADTTPVGPVAAVAAVAAIGHTTGQRQRCHRLKKRMVQI